MSYTKEPHVDDKACARRRPPSTEAQGDETLMRRGHPAVVIQRTGLAPSALTPRDVAQLQRALGNQAAGRLVTQTLRRQSIQRKHNNTALPDGLKAGVESLSGTSLDDVRVHYNSSRPEQFHASAYTEGTEIYLGPGQEKYLSHEAWHVVQQKQGRVAPGVEMRGKKVNKDRHLELEADSMGSRALTLFGEQLTETSRPFQLHAGEGQHRGEAISPAGGVIQLGKKTHIAAGALIGTIIPVIGTIIGGYIGYRIYLRKQRQRAAAAEVDDLQSVGPPPVDVTTPMERRSESELVEMEQKLEALSGRGVGVGRPGLEGTRPQPDPGELREFIETAKDLILSKQYKKAYEMLVDRRNAQGLGIDLRVSTQIVPRRDEMNLPQIIDRVARANMSFANERRIKITTLLIIRDDGFEDISDYPELSEPILPMYLEEYMHQYQARTKGFFSESTGRFKAQSGMGEGGIDAPDFDEVDVLAQFAEWGFDVEKIDYVKRYEEREAYWKWLESQRES